MGAAPVARMQAACLLLQFCGASLSLPFSRCVPTRFLTEPHICLPASMYLSNSEATPRTPKIPLSKPEAPRLCAELLSDFPCSHYESGRGLPGSHQSVLESPAPASRLGPRLLEPLQSHTHKTSRVLPAPWGLLKALQAARAHLPLDLPVSSPG